MKLQILASGSKGNCSIVTSASGRSLMIDIGIGIRDLRARMAGTGCSLDSVEALLVTHEHTDHCGHIPSLLAAREGLRCFATEGTATGVEQALARARAGRKSAAGPINWDIFESGQEFEVAGMKVESFPISHDCADPVGYAVTDGGCRIVVATDMGMVPAAVRRRLCDCDVLVLESNHDPDMLRGSDYPWPLKQRIAGRQGHLSNDQACELLKEVAGPRLKAVYLAHLSEQCNAVRVAESMARSALHSASFDGVSIRVARQSVPSDPYETH